MPIKPDPDLALYETETGYWVNERSVQNAYGLFLENKGYDVDLEIHINALGESRRIDLMAYSDHEAIMIEAKQSLTLSSAYQAIGQLNSYSRVIKADRLMMLVGYIRDEGAVATLNQTGIELVVYSPQDYREQRCGEPVYDDEPAYHAASQSSYYEEPDWTDGFDFFKWGGIAVLVLLVLGAIFNADPSARTRQPSQIGGIKRGQTVVVTPKGGTCQPLRLEADDASEMIGCVDSGKRLIAISDELRSGWVRVRGSANGTGWIYYHGLSTVPKAL